MFRLLEKLNTQTRYWLFIGAGLLLGLSFMAPWVWWLVLPGLVLFIYASLNTYSRTLLFLGGWLAGTLQFLLVLSWFWSVYPLDWLGLSNTASVLLIFFVWSTCAVALGIGKGLAALALAAVSRHSRKWALASFPFLWLFGELIGSFVFSIYTYGTGGKITAEFSTGYLGYLLAEHGLLLPLATYGGVFLLSFVCAGLAALLYFCYAYGYQKSAAALIVLVYATSLASSSSSTPDTQQVAALSTSYEAYVTLEKEQLFARQENLVKTVAETLEAGTKYIILPEDARFSSSFDSPEAVFHFLDTFGAGDEILVDSTAATDPDTGEPVVVSYVYDARTNDVYTIYKEYLIPTGEYLPTFHEMVIRLFGFGDAVDRFNGYYGYVPRVNNESRLPDGVPSVLFCFEAVSSVALKKAAARSGADFVAHPVSHSWFTNPWLLRHELDQMLRVNARFARTTVYMAANQFEARKY